MRAGPLPRAAQLQLGGSGGSILRIIGFVTPDFGDGRLFGTLSGHVICAVRLPGDEAQTTQFMRAILCRACLLDDVHLSYPAEQFLPALSIV